MDYRVNIRQDAITRNKFAQTLTFIFSILKAFGQSFLSWRWWKFNLSVVLHSNDSKNERNKKCDKLHLSLWSDILMFSNVFYSHSWENKFGKRQTAISISNKFWQAQVAISSHSLPSPKSQVFQIQTQIGNTGWF